MVIVYIGIEKDERANELVIEMIILFSFFMFLFILSPDISLTITCIYTCLGTNVLQF
jgi:hypothetical protein